MTIGTDRLVGRKDGAIGWMTFNNPLRRNAVSVDMWQAIPEVLAEFEADPAIRVIVFTGAGDKAFASGADISQFAEHRADREANEIYSAHSAEANRAMVRLSKPSIAMIRGYCIGGGMAVALTCDMRICSEDARFAIPAARLGLGYGFDGLKALADLVGPSFAKEIMFTARQFDAAEALRIGLVNRVASSGELEAAVRDTAAMIARNAPLTVKAAKMAVREAMKDPDRRQLDEVSKAIDACFQSQDYAEGRTAFMEKRDPVFQGR
ncbi:MAG TPA: enoyl-CoA hydratase [Caulobacteraceae bacterium]|jgi:enoyl-CoA hydratase/carnithine racemase|nr:enoyl-CoA hydratase [Caulobacteraceae bacterium]